MYAKISLLVNYVESIIFLILYNLCDPIFKRISDPVKKAYDEISYENNYRLLAVNRSHKKFHHRLLTRS